MAVRQTRSDTFHLIQTQIACLFPVVRRAGNVMRAGRAEMNPSYVFVPLQETKLSRRKVLRPPPASASTQWRRSCPRNHLGLAAAANTMTRHPGRYRQPPA
jgi:hypothetical protein